jgi:exopolyphosphatase/pppGpp-phosphohydrolase
VLAAALTGLEMPAAVVSDAGLREGILLDAVGWRPLP